MRDIRPSTPPPDSSPEPPEDLYKLVSEIKFPGRKTPQPNKETPTPKAVPLPLGGRPVQPQKPSTDGTGDAIKKRPLNPPFRAGSDITPSPRPVPSRIPGKSVPINNIALVPRDIGPMPAPRPIKTPQAATPRVRIGYRERLIIVGLLTLLAVAAILAGLIFLPKADIKLVLRTAPLLVEETLAVQTEKTSENVVPGTAFVREVEVTGSSSVASTEVVGTKTRGTVRLINRTSDVQKIKEQSRLVTKDNILFYMQKSANVPANGSTDVEVEAAEAGEQGNVTAQRLNFAALPAASQSLVYGEVVTTLKGGSGQVVNVVKESDLELAKTAAGKLARDQVEQDIRQELPKDWNVMEESWTAEATSFETDAKVGDKAPTIPYTARMVVRVIGYEKAAVENYLRQALEKRLDQEYMLFPGAIAYTTSVKDVNWEEARANITARVTHTTIPRFSLETLREKLASRSSREAQQYLEGLPGVQSVSMNLWPFWVQSIPRIEKRITLDLTPDKQP